MEETLHPVVSLSLSISPAPESGARSTPARAATNVAGRETNRRVLVVDDNRAIHDDFRKILTPPDAGASLDDLEAELFGEDDTPAPAGARHVFDICSAHQGQEALELAREAIAAERPYAMAFVDMRMPPGWDGLQTTLELWKVAPDLQIVICTAYSDYSWEELLARIGGSDQLVILKKPFDTIEVLQLANALTEKWNLLQAARLRMDQLESAVRERTAALEIEIAERRRAEAELQRAKDVADDAARAKGAFLANMSHEIRTPMNGVIGLANLLLDSGLTTEQRDLARTLSQCGETLLAIINDILDFSKIEAGKLSLEAIDFDLGELIEGTLDLHAEAAARKSLELVWDAASNTSARVRGDPVRLRQVLLNLVGNAVKFASRGEIAVRVAPAPDGNNGSEDANGPVLRFAVADQGIGIAPEAQKTLFQAFTQADSSTTRHYGGTGLGLAIVKRLVELMGGTVGLESAPGHGSTFWFTLPFGHAAPPLEPPETTADLSSFRALIVDDNETNRAKLRHLLDGWTLPNDAVASGPEALDELRRAAELGRPCDVVVLDHLMPGMDGLALAEAIRADNAIPPPKLVLLTTHATRLAPRELKRRGLAASHLKPVRAAPLRQCLAQALACRAPTRATAMGTRATATDVAILVAEDNPVNQKIALLQLQRLGYAADVVPDGRRALAALRRKSYRVVLMDSQMPHMDGLAATRRIRAAQAAGEPHLASDLRIIAMTANAMQGDREACLAAGMDDYVSKPVRIELLKAALDRALAPDPSPSA